MSRRKRTDENKLYKKGSDGKSYYVKQPFESRVAGITELKDVNSEPKCTIYLSMLKSDAWLNLSGGAIKLYHLMKLQAFSKNKDRGYKRQDGIAPIGTEFYFNKALIKKVYPGVASSMNQFYKDRDCLIENGFIKITNRGSYLDKTIYDLSDKWQTVERKPKRDTSKATAAAIRKRRELNQIS